MSSWEYRKTKDLELRDDPHPLFIHFLIDIGQVF